jgi:hypothetical protein
VRVGGKQGNKRLTRYKAIFANSANLAETDVSESQGLFDQNVNDAEGEALRLERPLGVKSRQNL